TRCAPGRCRPTPGCGTPCPRRAPRAAWRARSRRARARPRRCPVPCPAPARAPPVRTRRLLVAAARELGDDPAGGEGDAERGQRTFADQLRGAVDQVAALVHQRVHLFAAGRAGLLERGDARQRAVGQVTLDLGLAQAHFLARRGSGTLDRLACMAGGVLEVAAGLAEVGLDVVGGAGWHVDLLVAVVRLRFV